MDSPTKKARKVVLAQIETDPETASRFKALAAEHGRSAVAEARYAIRDWMRRHGAAAQPQGQEVAL